jgi:hypothetical protein
MTLAATFAAVLIEGGNADNRGDLTAIEAPQFRQVGQHGMAGDLAYAFKARQKIFLLTPRWRGTNTRLELFIQVLQFGFKPMNVLLNFGRTAFEAMG